MIDTVLSIFSNYEKKRKRLLKKAREGAMRDFLSMPFPSPKESIDRIPILSVDFETTGLNPNKDQILSIGHIEINNSEIQLGSACHNIIQTQGALNEENVIIHQITDDIKARGQTLEHVIEKLLAAMAGKVMLVHFARIETKFLNAACIKLYGIAPVIPIIDTVILAKRRLDRQSVPYDPSELRLFNLRERYSLPRYKAHNALSDAIATAELFFAECGIIETGSPAKLKQVIT